MSIDERDRRATAGGREVAGRAPRSGGRTAVQRAADDDNRRTPAGRVVADRTPTGRGSSPGVRGARRPDTQAHGTQGHGTQGHGTQGHGTQGHGTQGHGTQGHGTQGTAALKLDAAEPVRVTAATEPRLRVAPPAPIRTPRAPFVALVIAIVLAGVLGILWINTKTMENSFRIDQLRDQQSALDNQQQQLERQIASYENTGNLDAAARMLGLVKSDKLAYITLPNGDEIGMPQPNNARPALTAKGTGTAGPSTGGPGSGLTQNAGR